MVSFVKARLCSSIMSWNALMRRQRGKQTMSHKHDFLSCGYDEQQCDSACRASGHLCSTCGKSRSELAKDAADVRQHVVSSAQRIIAELLMVEQLPLTEAVKLVARCSKQLDWLSREQLVEMAVG